MRLQGIWLKNSNYFILQMAVQRQSHIPELFFFFFLLPLQQCTLSHVYEHECPVALLAEYGYRQRPKSAHETNAYAGTRAQTAPCEYFSKRGPRGAKTKEHSREKQFWQPLVYRRWRDISVCVHFSFESRQTIMNHCLVRGEKYSNKDDTKVQFLSLQSGLRVWMDSDWRGKLTKQSATVVIKH